MGIYNLLRDYGVDPAIVRMATTDNYATVTVAGYLTTQIDNIFNINGGAFNWLPSDIILCNYSDGFGFFIPSTTFTSMTPLNPDGGILPIVNGGTGVSSVTTTPSANSWAGWDANENLAANNEILGIQTLTTDDGTVTLTSGSPYTTLFIGTDSETIVMPVVSTLSIGLSYRIINASDGSVTIKSSGLNTIKNMIPSTTAIVTCRSTTGTGIASWVFDYIADSTEIIPVAAASNQMLQSVSGSDPDWSTATYPASTTINQLLYSSAANTVSGLATANNAVLTTNSSGVPSWTAATFPITWAEISGTTQSAAVNTGYIIQNAAQTTVTLPATAAIGSIVAIAGQGAAGWVLAPNAGQTIKILTGSAGTSITSAEQYDCIEVVCVVANTTWVTRSSMTTGFTVA